MCTLCKIVHGLCYFPLDIVSQRPSVSQRTDRQFLLYQPFARTNTFTVHLYHILQTYGTHSLRGSSHPHSLLLKLMLCITYKYFILLYACLVFPLGTLCISISYLYIYNHAQFHALILYAHYKLAICII